jgi:hypothetical protein
LARHSDRAVLLNINCEALRSIKIEQGDNMVARGEAAWYGRGKRFVKLLEAQKANAISQIRGTSISLAEVEANVGLRGCRRRARRGYVGNFVDRSMTKIEIWPEVGDTFAIRVGPSGVMRPKPPQSDSRQVLNAKLFGQRQA